MQSVASLNPLDPRPTPAPDRKDAGDDSFSHMLDAASQQQPDNPAPDAVPPSGDDSSPPPSSPSARKTASRPANDPSAQSQGDSDKTSASCKRSGGDTPKAGDTTAEQKGSGKGSKQSSKDDSAKDAAQAIVAPGSTQNVPQAAMVALVALDAPKADGAGNASASGDCAKATEVDIAAAAAVAAPVLVAPGTLGASAILGASTTLGASGVPVIPGALVAPEALVASEASKLSAGTPAPANEVVGQAAAAIENAAKGKRPSPPSDMLAAADDVSQEAANAVPAAKTLADAAKSAVAIDGSGSTPKPLVAGKAPSGKSPTQPVATSVEADNPSSGSDPTTSVRFTAKAVPDSHTPATTSGDQDLGAAVARDVSAAPQSAQSASIPDALRVLASALGPASTQIQAPNAPVSAQGVPATTAAIAVEIAARAKEGSNQFDIRLDPPELGRIDVRLDVDKDGSVSTRLTVDRPETLDLLRNDARGLEQALQSAGLKTEDGSLQFSLRQQSPDGSAGQQQAQGETDPRSGTVYVEEDESASAGLDQYQWAARQRGGVDIRV